MNGPRIQPRLILAATVVIGGILVLALPQFAMSILQIVIVTAAVVFGVFALESNVPETGWVSPFKWMSPFRRGSYSWRKGNKADEIGSIRRKLSGWRQPIPPCPPMPPEVLGLLRPMIQTVLGLPSEGMDDLAEARAYLSPGTFAVLASDPSKPPPWFLMLPPNKEEVAEAVHGILDELDRIGTDIEGDILSPHSGQP